MSVTRRRGQTDIRGLVTAGRAVRQEHFCWSKTTSVTRGVNPVAAHSGNAGRSSRGRLLVFLVRLLWGWVDETSDAAGGLGSRRVCSLSRAIPAGAWEGSTWSTRSAASMNDVDADEHWQTMAEQERPRRVVAVPGPACCWS